MVHEVGSLAFYVLRAKWTKLFILEYLQAILFAGGASFGNPTGSPRQDKNNFTSIRNEKKDILAISQIRWDSNQLSHLISYVIKSETESLILVWMERIMGGRISKVVPGMRTIPSHFAYSGCDNRQCVTRHPPHNTTQQDLPASVTFLINIFSIDSIPLPFTFFTYLSCCTSWICLHIGNCRVQYRLCV